MSAAPLQIEPTNTLLSRAHGTILELGPGGGDQMRHFAASASSGKITLMYGAEPNSFLHTTLLARAKAAGLDSDKYKVLTAGAQPDSLIPALQRAGVLDSNKSEGLFDTIIAVKSLCSVPQSSLPSTLAVLQALLKPDGEFLFFEHVANVEDRLAQMWAWVLDWAWPAIMGGCRLDGRLDVLVQEMGGWSSCEVRNLESQKGFEVLRYVVGVCRKA